MTDPIRDRLDQIEESWRVDRMVMGYATPDTPLMLAALRDVLDRIESYEATASLKALGVADEIVERFCKDLRHDIAGPDALGVDL